MAKKAKIPKASPILHIKLVFDGQDQDALNHFDELRSVVEQLSELGDVQADLELSSTTVTLT